MKKYYLLLFVILLTGCIKEEAKINYEVDADELEELRYGLDDYPLILVHGHAVSVGEAANFLSSYKKTGSFKTFNDFQKKLDEDKLYESKNIILPFHNSSVCNNLWNKKISVRTTYYVDYNGEFNDRESIEVYAERLSNVIDIVKKCTNSSKVNLIGHSMGGLVIREYARNNNENVNKIITIATPNKGVQKEYLGGLNSLCGEFRYEEDIECREMQVNSEFLRKLNEKSIDNINYYSINGVIRNKEFFGVACLDHGLCNDGVICTKSAQLENAKNYVFYAETPLEEFGKGVHNDLIDPETEPGFKAYNYSIRILANKDLEENSNEINNSCINKDINFDVDRINLKNINFKAQFDKLKSNLLELF